MRLSWGLLQMPTGSQETCCPSVRTSFRGRPARVCLCPALQGLHLHRQRAASQHHLLPSLCLRMPMSAEDDPCAPSHGRLGLAFWTLLTMSNTQPACLLVSAEDPMQHESTIQACLYMSPSWPAC